MLENLNLLDMATSRKPKGFLRDYTRNTCDGDDIVQTTTYYMAYENKSSKLNR